MASGSWALAEELFNRGDAGFVAELRAVHDADRLGKFASRWLADRRPFARQALIEYLSQPFNCYRHEALVKRLFKLIEQAGDDELLGALLVAFDRSVRRRRTKVTRHKWDNVATLEEARAKLLEWEAAGYETPPWRNWEKPRGRFHIYASKQEDVVAAPNNVMPRPTAPRWLGSGVSDALVARYEKRFLLFSQPTRRYLRRRAWRYFRKLDPVRFRNAAVVYLKRYRDVDVDSDIHLLDNWGLVHTLFGESPALECPARGWRFAPGKSAADLAAAPRLPEVWRAAPEAILDLLVAAPCRTVRQWAKSLLMADHREWLTRLAVAELLKLVDHPDSEIAALGFDGIEKHPDLATVSVDWWLARLEGDDLEKLQRFGSLLQRLLDPNRVSLTDVVKLATARSLPVANLGLALLRGRTRPAVEDVPLLLTLAQAGCETVRGDLAKWLKDAIQHLSLSLSECLLEFLDSKHADVRALGWDWLMETPLRDDPLIWQRLLESPYDEVKERLVAELDLQSKAADPGLVRWLWASVLLNVHRGGRSKPGVVTKIVERLGKHEEEAASLLPLLAVAVRSLRGPEFRAGLAGVVSLYEDKPELRPAIARQFPELNV